MVNNKMNIIILAIYVAAMILVSIISVLAILFFPAILTDDALFITFNSAINLFLYITLFLLFVIIFKKYFRSQLKDLFQNKIRLMIIIAIGFIVMLAASVLSTVIMEALGVTETSENQEALNMLLEGTLFDKIALFSFAVLLVPLIEEMVFRKGLFDLFHFQLKEDDGSKGAKYKKIALAIFAVLISSFLFGLIHVTSGDFIQIIYYAGLGVVLGVLYLVSKKNIFVPITVHFLVNFLVTTILLLDL